MRDYFEEIKKAAWEAGVTVNKLCTLSNVNAATVWRWKTGKTEPSMRTFNKMIETAADLRSKNQFYNEYKP